MKCLSREPYRRRSEAEVRKIAKEIQEGNDDIENYEFEFCFILPSIKLHNDAWVKSSLLYSRLFKIESTEHAIRTVNDFLAQVENNRKELRKVRNFGIQIFLLLFLLFAVGVPTSLTAFVDFGSTGSVLHWARFRT
jgi:hypothetical protein